MTDSIEWPVDAHARMAPGALGAWWRQGLRTAFFLKPDWRGLQTTPSVIACWVVAVELLRIFFQRVYIPGPARFHWPALLAGWFGTAVTIWVCWLLVPRVREAVEREPGSVAALFTMFCAQDFALSVITGLLLWPVMRSDGLAATASRYGAWAAWGAWILAIGWYVAAALALVWRSGARRIAPRIVATILLVGTTALLIANEPPRLWYASKPAGQNNAAYASLKLTPEQLELQPKLLQEKLHAIGSGRSGVVNLYAITFAPYADDVFQRESHLVAAVMQERFNTGGRTIQLINSRATIGDMPWATPSNLHRSIQRMAQVMNHDRDILFIHLTSHDARDGSRRHRTA
jgi:hypothetical protein